MKRLPVSTAEFLKCVYQMHYNDGVKVTSAALSKQLGVSNIKVNMLIRRMIRLSYVSHEPYQEVKLTDDGKCLAMSQMRVFGLLATYLHQAMNFDVAGAFAEAQKLEFSASEAFVDRIDELLGYPQIDPSGAPIPNVKGETTPIEGALRLSQLKVGYQARIIRLNHSSSVDVLFYDKHAIELGLEVTMIAALPADNGFEVLINNEQFFIGSDKASRIFVK
jgi:DtxR family Mn-dependent transcriptional regulator